MYTLISHLYGYASHSNLANLLLYLLLVLHRCVGLDAQPAALMTQCRLQHTCTATRIYCLCACNTTTVNETLRKRFMMSFERRPLSVW